MTKTRNKLTDSNRCSMIFIDSNRFSVKSGDLFDDQRSAWHKEYIAQSDPVVGAARSPTDGPLRRHIQPGTGTKHESIEDQMFARSTLLSFDAK